MLGLILDLTGQAVSRSINSWNNKKDKNSRSSKTKAIIKKKGFQFSIKLN